MLLRQSARLKTKPIWMSDFVCAIHDNFHSDYKTNLRSSQYIPPTYAFLFPKHFSSAHMSFIANVFTVQEPKSYLEAKKYSSWVKAMEFEIDALEKNHAWEITYQLEKDHKM